MYQYTAIDDCTRIRALAIYPRRSAANSLLFLERAIEEFPFPIQAIQTDCGREFFAYSFQEKLMEYAIKFRPVRAGVAASERRCGREACCIIFQPVSSYFSLEQACSYLPSICSQDDQRGGSCRL